MKSNQNFNSDKNRPTKLPIFGLWKGELFILGALYQIFLELFKKYIIIFWKKNKQ